MMKTVAFLTIVALAVQAQRHGNGHGHGNGGRPNNNHHNGGRHVIEGRGQVWCGDRPAAGVMVQLWSENSQFGQFGRDTFLGATHTSQSGNFNIRTNSRDPKFHQRRYIVIQHTCGSRQLQMARFPMFPDQMIRVQLRVNSNPTAFPPTVFPPTVFPPTVFPPTVFPPFPVAVAATNNRN